jgi:hypothetical protein
MLSNVGSNGCSLAYRRIGPLTLLAMIAVVLRALGRQTPRQTPALFAALAVTMVTAALSSAYAPEFRTECGLAEERVRLPGPLLTPATTAGPPEPL